MFTGIVQDIGRIEAVDSLDGGDRRWCLDASWKPEEMFEGASVCVAGVCLSAHRIEARGSGCRFFVVASAHTLGQTTLESYRPGDRVNLERALRVGDSLDGHILFGHVDGRGTIRRCRKQGLSLRVACDAPAAMARFIAAGGSIAMDGVSLTVCAAQSSRFEVQIIDWTRRHTTLGDLSIGLKVNLESDMIARYAVHAIEKRVGSPIAPNRGKNPRVSRNGEG